LGKKNLSIFTGNLKRAPKQNFLGANSNFWGEGDIFSLKSPGDNSLFGDILLKGGETTKKPPGL